MLTGDLAMSWRRGRSTGPRYIDSGGAAYLQVAADLINLFRQHVGLGRAALDEALEEYVGSGTDYRILRGLIKLLEDRCTFETSSLTAPAEIRRALFLRARARHPVSDEARGEVVTEISREFGCAPEAIIEGLYADLAAHQKLMSFDEPAPPELLDRYNLAQAQALLYRCVEMQILVEPQATAGYRQLFDAIKYHRLIHSIRGSAAAGYEVRLSGPVSIFHRSQKYGVQMAVFLPALLACRKWSMRAEIDMKAHGSAYFELNSGQARLRSDYSYEALAENPVAERLVARWAGAGGAWAIERSRQVIDLGASVFIPDFALRHTAAEEVYLEILGFWTPRHLAERLKEFERAGFSRFILLASEELRGSRDAATGLPANVVLFKSSPDPKDVKSAVDKIQDSGTAYLNPES